MQPENLNSTEAGSSRPLVRPPNLRHKIAAELDQLRADMEDIGVQLCLDEEIMVRCLAHLQRLDELGQRSIWLAELVRADDPREVIPEITLQSLADRLKG